MPSWGEPEPVAEARAIGATCGDVRVWSVYVPNGRQIGDPHMDYKVAWLEALAAAGRGWLAADPQAQVAFLGDWNVAPTDDDVWSPEFYADKSHTSPQERAGFAAVVEAGYADVVRPYHPGPGVYTYWDYQRLRFARREGMRIDFVLASPALAARVTGAVIDREERKGKGASDHAPVLVQLG
jgi:exodeoxyribonuclease-3